MREWLLMQAHLQQDYVDSHNAEHLLEIIEAAYGESVTTGLMLCKAFCETGELPKLEAKASSLLAYSTLSCEQRASIYFFLSQARWRAEDRIGARRAYELYLSLINEEEAVAYEALTTQS
ncbi:MAG: hypothetical protein HWE26_17680 [Alteromonadaceae bacterium]|nr:hypothetical protein [Alteromonadaceae bacterium]